MLRLVIVPSNKTCVDCGPFSHQQKRRWGKFGEDADEEGATTSCLAPAALPPADLAQVSPPRPLHRFTQLQRLQSAFPKMLIETTICLRQSSCRLSLQEQRKKPSHLRRLFLMSSHLSGTEREKRPPSHPAKHSSIASFHRERLRAAEQATHQQWSSFPRHSCHR
jgi:hypothetical protein